MVRIAKKQNRQQQREQTFLVMHKEIQGLQPSSVRNAFAFCLFCKRDFAVSHWGAFNIRWHCGKEHYKLLKLKRNRMPLQITTQFMPLKTEFLGGGS